MWHFGHRCDESRVHMNSAPPRCTTKFNPHLALHLCSGRHPNHCVGGRDNQWSQVCQVPSCRIQARFVSVIAVNWLTLWQHFLTLLLSCSGLVVVPEVITHLKTSISLFLQPTRVFAIMTTSPPPSSQARKCRHGRTPPPARVSSDSSPFPASDFFSFLH
jgi:hypothetical protein